MPVGSSGDDDYHKDGDSKHDTIAAQLHHAERIALLSTCFVIIIVNSCIIVMALCRKATRRENCTIFFVNLMLAHLLLGVSELALFATSGIGLCIAINMLVITNMANLCVLSIDRMVAIKYPLRYIRTEKSVFLMVFCCSWLVPISVFLLRWNYRSNESLSRKILCITIIFAYLGTVVILGTVNWLVFREARMQIVKIRRNQVTSLQQLGSVSKNQVAPAPYNDLEGTSTTEGYSSTGGTQYSQLPRPSGGGESLSNDTAHCSSPQEPTSAQRINSWRRVIRRQKREIRAAYICAGCVLSFAVLWAVYIAYKFSELLHDGHESWTLQVAGKQIAFLNLVVDPFLYTYLNKSMQSALGKAFCRWRRRKVDQLPQRSRAPTVSQDASTAHSISS